MSSGICQNRQSDPATWLSCCFSGFQPGKRTHQPEISTLQRHKPKPGVAYDCSPVAIHPMPHVLFAKACCFSFSISSSCMKTYEFQVGKDQSIPDPRQTLRSIFHSICYFLFGVGTPCLDGITGHTLANLTGQVCLFCHGSFPLGTYKTRETETRELFFLVAPISHGAKESFFLVS